MLWAGGTVAFCRTKPSDKPRARRHSHVVPRAAHAPHAPAGAGTRLAGPPPGLPFHVWHPRPIGPVANDSARRGRAVLARLVRLLLQPLIVHGRAWPRTVAHGRASLLRKASTCVPSTLSLLLPRLLLVVKACLGRTTDLQPPAIRPALSSSALSRRLRQQLEAHGITSTWPGGKRKGGGSCRASPNKRGPRASRRSLHHQTYLLPRTPIKGGISAAVARGLDVTAETSRAVAMTALKTGSDPDWLASTEHWKRGGGGAIANRPPLLHQHCLVRVRRLQPN